MLPESASGTASDRGSLPQTMRTASLANRITPNVASTWSRWLRPYRKRNTNRSSSSPNRIVPTAAASSPSTKLPLAAAADTAR